MADKSGELLKKGEVLFAQGEKPGEIFTLQSGSLEIISTPNEYSGLDRSIIISKGKRIGIISGSSMLCGFSRYLTEPYTKTLRALEDSHFTRQPLPQGGYKDIIGKDPVRAVNILKHIYNSINVSMSTSARIRKIYQTLLILNDNLSLVYHSLAQNDAPVELHEASEELFSAFRSSGGSVPDNIDAKFVIMDMGRFIEKNYDQLSGDPEEIIDKKSCGFIFKFLKVNPSIFQAAVKADPSIAMNAFEILTDNMTRAMDFIESTFSNIDETMNRLFGVEESWSSYLVDSGGLGEWMSTGRLNENFIKQILAIMMKLNGLYEEITGRKLTDDYPGVKNIHSYFLQKREGNVIEKKVTVESVEKEEAAAEKPAFVPSRGKGRSMNEIFEFALTDKESKTRMVKLLNDFKNLKNPMNTDSDSRKVRRHISNLYWDIFKQVYIRSRTESTIPKSVKLMLNYGFFDDDLLEEGQIEELNELARIREKDVSLPVVLEYEFLSKIMKGEEEPSITEMGLDYRAYLRELEKSRRKKDKGEVIQDENMKRVIYEIEQRLASTAAVCSGSTATAFPLLNSFAMKGSLKSIHTTKKQVEDIVKNLMSIDFSAFYRETVLKIGDAREIIEEEIIPYFIILPIFGTKTLLWQEIVGTNKRSRGRIVIPAFFMGDLEKSLAHTLACFRWELNRSMKGAMWADPIDGGVTGEYFDYVNTFKKNSKLSTEAKDKIKERFKAFRTNRDRFADDYLTWVLFEKDGIMKLNNVVREMFYKHIPFREEVRNKLEAMPAFSHAANRYKNLQTRNITALERKFKKYMNAEGHYPKEIQKYFNFLKQ